MDKREVLEITKHSWQTYIPKERAGAVFVSQSWLHDQIDNAIQKGKNWTPVEFKGYKAQKIPVELVFGDEIVIYMYVDEYDVIRYFAAVSSYLLTFEVNCWLVKYENRYCTMTNEEFRSKFDLETT